MPSNSVSKGSIDEKPQKYKIGYAEKAGQIYWITLAHQIRY